MFKKLKQKLDYDEVAETSPQKSSSSRSLNQSDESTDDDRAIKKAHSKSRRSIDQSLNLNQHSSKEDLLSALMQRTTQVKKLEIKLAEYGRSLKDTTHERDKLMAALERQQDTAMRRLAELNETSTEAKTQLESSIRRLEKSEGKLLKKVENLTLENDRLSAAMQEWENNKEKFEKTQQEFYSKKEVSEELQDLQVQETAKIKHLLMNREKECTRLQTELDETLAQLIQAQEISNDLEGKERLLRENNKSLNEEVKELQNQNETLTQSLTVMKSSNETQQKDNHDLKNEIAILTSKLQKATSELTNMEHSNISISEKYESLKHSSALIISKATRDIEEKENTVTYLQNKLQNLESRAKNEQLPLDEKMKALVDERTSLENHLEESYQQLNNIKSTWSVQINHLETQVSHLNAKISEDAQEYDAILKRVKEEKNKLKSEVVSLNKELHEASEEKTQMSHQSEIFIAQIATLEAKVIEQNALIEIEKNKNEKTAQKHKSKTEDMEMKLKDQIKKLEDKNKELKLIVETNEDEAKKLVLEKGEITTECKNFQKQLESCRIDLEEKQTKIDEICDKLDKINLTQNDLESERDVLKEELLKEKTVIEKLKEKLEQVHKEYSDLKLQCEKLKIEVAESQSKYENIETQLTQMNGEKEKLTSDFHLREKDSDEKFNDLNNKISELTATLDSRQIELMECKQKFAELKNTQSEDSTSVATMEAEMLKLREKLTERDRLYKVQQQKLNDLKKALSKELNKQPGTNSRPVEDVPAVVVNGNGAAVMETDEGISPEQREVTMKYLKHLVLKFLSCSSSESAQLIKALSMILKFTRDEEKLLKESVLYKNSWFSAKPSPRGSAKPTVKARSGKR